MKISIVAAVSQNGVIGDGKNLLWHIPGDLPRFKQITSGHHILMGRKTFDSIGRVLPDRTNLIVSKNKKLKIPGAEIFSTPEDAVNFAKENGEHELMVIGGGTIYKYLLSKTQKIYLTRIFKDYNADVKFPNLNFEEWNKVIIEENLTNDPPFEVCELTRK